MATEPDELKSLSFDDESITAIALKTPNIYNEDDIYDETKNGDDHMNESDDKKHNIIKDKILIRMKSKLGESEKSFYISQLKKLKYFENQLSGRWDINDNTISMQSKQLNFSVDEISEILDFLIYEQLSPSYPYKRLPFLCAALDYLTENKLISTKTYFEYFQNVIPCIQPSHLEELKETCLNLKECEILVESITNYLDKEVENTSTNFNDKVIENWESVSLKVLIANGYIAASVFINHFKFMNGRIDITAKREVTDLSILWKYIKDKKLCKQYPQIIQTIFDLKYAFDYWNNGKTTINEEESAILTNLTLDIIEILFTENLDINTEVINIKVLVHNMFEIINEQWFEQKSSKCSYDFMMAVLEKLFRFRLNNEYEDNFNIYCGNMDIIGFLVKNVDTLVSAAKEKNILKEIKSLILLLNDDEKCNVLQVLLDNYQKMNLGTKQLQEIVKPLIEVNYELTFKMTLLWFPLFMKDKKYQEWIIKEIPSKTSWNILKILINGICDYIVSNDYMKNPCDSVYVTFINQYTKINWDIQ